MKTPHICLIGQFIVDVTLPTSESPYKLRAGGIMHAARALWAIDCPYSLCYCAPDYLTSQIEENGRNFSATHTERFGTVTGSPNVILIGEPKEVGNQQYELLLRDSHACHINASALRDCLARRQASDVLIFPGGYNLSEVLESLRDTDASVFADASYDPEDPSLFARLSRQFESLIYSTSSPHFLNRFKGNFGYLHAALLGKYAKSVMLKENRGGTRFIRDETTIATHAQVRPILHSIGVGDCFSAVFVALRHRVPEKAALAYASCIAAEYASTTYPDVFREQAQAWLKVPEDEISDLIGISLPWESRPTVQVYIAAPDFDYVNRSPIDAIAAALRYHNFTPRLPVRENGQMGRGADASRRQALCDADLSLLDECQLLLAVLIFDDPGTLIEIGIAAERGIPVIVYDPDRRADNLMLTQLPHHISSDLDRVISAVFECACRIIHE